MSASPHIMKGNASQTETETQDGLQALLVRLEHQSLQPDFVRQREKSLELALQPYLDPLITPRLSPLPEELDLAKWVLYADYFPTDGHYSLIEQVRDLITEHVPDDERVWLDPFRHSYMDLLEVIDQPSENQSGFLQLQSLGNQQVFHVLPPLEPLSMRTGHIFLTRLIRGNSDVCLPGVPLMMSATIGKAVFSCTENLRREIEISTSNFALSDWPAFAKSYGYLMIWSLGMVRRGAWAMADSHIPFKNSEGEPFLYALALYEHPDFHLLKEGLHSLGLFKPLKDRPFQSYTPDPSIESSSRVWVQPLDDHESQTAVVSRLTLTATQLWVETDSAERLDLLKHQLAATFGFSLHFKGETTTPPPHFTPEVDVLSDTYFPSPIIVSQEKEQQLLSSFLESVYLEWAEQPSPALQNMTPRHFCSKNSDKTKVAALINDMEQHDLAHHRTRKMGYNYTILRDHVGL